MEKKYSSIFLFFILLTINVLYQYIIVPQTKLYEHLLRHPGTVFSIRSEVPNTSKTL